MTSDAEQADVTVYSNREERQLVLRAQDGEVEAFEVLVDRHQGRLFRVAFMVLNDRQDSEDVVQETLVLAWKRLHLLDDPDAFRAWLAKICTRRATDVVRRRARRATDAAASEDLEGATAGIGGASSPAGDPARIAEVNAQMRTLAQTLETLDPDMRACWVLREIDGMSYQEIATALQLTEPTVRGRIARARTQIIRQMEGWR